MDRNMYMRKINKSNKVRNFEKLKAQSYNHIKEA